MATTTRMKPSLASIIKRVLASVPGEQMTLAEVVDGARYHGYDYDPLCDGDDGRILGLTEKALARLVDEGQAAESMVNDVRVWTRHVCAPMPAVSAEPRRGRALPTVPRAAQAAPRRDEEPESKDGEAQEPWWPLTPANVFGLAFLVLVLVAVGMAWYGLVSWADQPHWCEAAPLDPRPAGCP